MLIGLISDSHDNLTQLAKAVELLERQQVEMVLHAGDYVAPFTVKILAGLSCDWQGVFGNNDGEKPGLMEVSAGRIKSEQLELELAGRKIVVVHDLTQLDSGGKWDLIVHGHTHRTEVKEEAGRLVVNPGECCGWLTGQGTVGLLDLESMEVKILEL